MNKLFYNYELWIAYRYLRARRDDGFISIVSWFSLIGISLGVAALIIVMSVMNGFREELLTRIMGLNGHATLYFDEKNISNNNFENIQNTLFNFSEIKKVSALVESTVMISNNDINRGVILKGISLNDLKSNDLLIENIDIETIKLFGEKNFIILGKRLSTNLGLKQGDSIQLIAPTGTNTPFGKAPSAKKFIFAGTFDVGMYEYDSSVIFMKINDLRQFLGMSENYIDKIEIKYFNPESAEILNSNIEDVLNATQTQDFILIPWMERHKQLSNALEVEKNVMFIILSLIILVAAFNIISSMIMLVRDKQASISILKTIGMSDYSVLKVFMMVGSSIGLLGTITGLFIGVIFSKNINYIKGLLEKISGTNIFEAEIYFLSSLPAKINFSEVLVVAFFSFFITVIATIYPAWRASKLDPVKVLRHV
ncbi:MAG: lipoprotein-releasing system transmembrane subunit LolC [Pelagibacterales bacterium]|nr:lipoprotein-releasing system transmembrane subunit LolC [Pelagibacterales bacterium]